MNVEIEQSQATIEIGSPLSSIEIGGKIVDAGVRQIYKGDTEPTNKNILIWIDTSTSPITGTQLITADNKNFITSDNKAFILSEITPDALLTKDNKEFIEANNKKFILREEN